MDVIARPPACDGQAADAISAHTPVQMEGTPRLLRISKSECPDIWTQSWSNIEDLVVLFERILYGHPLTGLLWERQFEEVLVDGNKVRNWECLFVHREQGSFFSVHVDDTKMAGEKQKLMKHVCLDEPTSFLCHIYLGALNVSSNRTQSLPMDTKCFESRISVGAAEKLPGWEKLQAVVLRHGRSCSKLRGKRLRIGKQKDKATVRSFKSFFG